MQALPPGAQKFGGMFGLKPGNLSPEEQALAGWDENQSNAQRDMNQQLGAVEQAQQARGLNAQVASQAAEFTPYGMSPADLAGAEQVALNNPSVAALSGHAANGFGQAGQAAGSAFQAAKALQGAGSFQPAMAGQANQFGEDVGLIRAAAEGRGPSAAEHLARASLDSNARNMQAVAAGARGGNLAAGIRAATQAGAQQGLQSTQQLAALRAQEQLGAMGQLAGANAALGQNLQGAQATETARQAAGVQGGIGAAGALTDVGNAQTSAMSAAGQLYGQGAQTNAGLQGVKAGVARDAAAALEDQKRRALEAARLAQQGVQGEQTLRNQRILGRMQGEITPGQVLGGVFGAGGAALAGALQ